MSTLMSGFVAASAIVGGFMSRLDDPELLRPYVDRFVEALPAVWEHRSIDEAETFTESVYPRFLADDRVIKAIDKSLADERLPAPARRFLREGRDGTLRAQRAQAADRAAGEAVGTR
jgi:aminopeptidase N